MNLIQLNNDVDLSIGSCPLIKKGKPLDFDRNAVANYIKSKFNSTYLVDDNVMIRLVVGNGRGKGFAWGCDLSDQYVRINADYTTQTKKLVIAVSYRD